jgi:hypothetical protein
MSPVRYRLDYHISEDYILHSHRRENLKSYRGKRLMPRANALTPLDTSRERGQMERERKERDVADGRNGKI